MPGRGVVILRTMDPRRAVLTPLLAVRGPVAARRDDPVAVEEPLEIRAGGPTQEPVRVAVTMRTPGHDHELAVGFLRGEGIVRGPHDLGPDRPRAVMPVVGRGEIVVVSLAHDLDPARFARNFYTTSACGVCGKAALDQVEVSADPLGTGPTVAASTLLSLPLRLREAQETFEATGGLHATGIFSADGYLRVVREDVGRHNAMDKALGRLLLDGEGSLGDTVVMLSGRASFELVQKAALAGVTVLCAVGAPSSLAVALAQRLGMTLVGFLRGDGFNLYAHPRRVTGLPGGA